MLTPDPFGTRSDPSPFLDTLDEVLGTAARLFATRLVAVSRIEGTACTLMAVIDHKRQIRPGTVLHLDDAFCAPTLEHNAPLQIDDVGAVPNAERYAFNSLGIPINAYLGVPLRLGNGRAWGSLWTINGEPYAFSPNDVRMLGLLARSLIHELEAAATQHHYKRIEQLQATRMDIDPLTGVLGRAGWLGVLADQGIWRHESDVYAVAVVRLNPFTQSRARSDVVHQGLADMLMRTMRLIDYCGRIDNTTYAVLLPDTTLQESHTWQQRLHAEVEAWNRVHLVAGLAFEVVLGVADSSEAVPESDNSLSVLERARERVQG